MQLKTLGGLRLEGSSYRGLKPLLLLAYLCLEGPRSRREVAELFWMKAKNPRDSLSVAIRQLRKVAGDVIQADQEKVWVNLLCDADEVFKLLDADHYEKALESYEGSFLEGFDLPLSEEIEEWVFSVREYLAGRVREARLRLGEAAIVNGQTDMAAKQAEAAYMLRGAPEPEPELYQRLYKLLLAGGSSYAAKVRHEAESFGVTLVVTSESTDVVIEEAQPAWVPIRHNLPTRSTSFVGRDPELLEIARLLEEPQCRLLILHGIGGIGKSRLALQAAHEQLKSEQFADGIYLILLDTLPDPSLILQSIAEALGLDLQGRVEPLELVKRHIKNQSILLVLDNYEHLLEGAMLTSELLQVCPKLKILVTSRERLNLEEEWLISLQGLPIPDATGLSLEHAQYADGLQLFAQRAQRTRLNFTISEETLPYALKICQLLGGSPLGIELAAVWVKTLSLAEIVEEIERSLAFLSTRTRNIPEMHRSIQAAFDHSWELLIPREQAVLRKLSVFRGGFQKEAASMVAAATIPVLASLVDKSLLNVAQGGRYDMHPLFYHYTQEKLAENLEEETEVRNLHATYFFGLLMELDDKAGSVTDTNMWAGRNITTRLEEDFTNLRVAWRWAVENLWLHELQRAMTVLWRFLHSKTRFLDGHNLTSQAIEALSETDPSHQGALGSMLTLQAGCSWWLGKLKEGRLLAERGLALLQPSRDDINIAFATTLLGGFAWKIGDYAQVKLYLQEAYEMARNTKHRLGRSITNLAHAEKDLGNYDRAEELLLESLEMARDSVKLDRAVSALVYLGNLKIAMKAFSEAEALLEEALNLARKIRYREVEIVQNIAYLAFEQGDHKRAFNLAQTLLKVSQKSGDYDLENFIQVLLGRLATAQGDYVRAQISFDACLSQAWSSGARPHVLRALIGVAELLAQQSQDKKAIRLLSLAVRHSAAAYPDKEWAQGLLEKLEKQVSAEVFITATERGKTLKLEEVMEEILSQATASPL